MSQWVGDKEVGLAPGQTGGVVGGTYIKRPEGYDPNVVFVVESKEQSAQKAKLLESKTATHTSPEEYGRQVRYLQAIGRPVIPQGEIYVKPNMTPEQLHLLENMPRASGAAPARMRQDYYPSFTPYAPGKTEPQLPYTPIEKETPAGYGYVTYPLYERASGLSNWLQGGIERGVESLPIPSQAKEITSGFYSFFTGLPAWGASGLVGWEAVARTEDKKKVPGMFASGAVRMGSDIVQQAKAEPFKMAGFGLGMIAAPHITKVPKSISFNMPSSPKVALPSLKEIISKPNIKVPQLKTFEYALIPIKPPTPQIGHMAAIERGARLRQTITGSETSFGSKGYRPTGTPKPSNIFTTTVENMRKGRGGNIPGLLILPGRDVPNTYALYTGELKRLPQTITSIKTRRSVALAEREPIVLPGLKNLQVASKPVTSTKPITKATTWTAFRVSQLAKTVAKSAVLIRPMTSTRTKTAIQTLIKPQTRVITSSLILARPKVATRTKTILATSTATATRIALLPLTSTATKTATRTATRTATATQLLIDIRKPTKIKGSSLFSPIRKKKKGKRSFGAFPELSRIATPFRLLTGTFSLKRKRFRL